MTQPIERVAHCRLDNPIRFTARVTLRSCITASKTIRTLSRHSPHNSLISATLTPIRI
jgi:hypothetical protein